jgi:N-formylmaleamate deformylase
VGPRDNSVFVRANGLRHHVLQFGEGPPTVLMLPGITSFASSMAFVGEQLAPYARAYSVDLRGRGLTDHPNTGFLLETYADDVAGLVEALELESPIILGHSIGARIAVAARVLHPRACGPLIVVDPPGTGPGRAPYGIPLETFLSALTAEASVEEMRQAFPKWATEHLELRRAWLHTCSAEAVTGSYRSLHEEDFFAFWQRLADAADQRPVLLAYGEETPALSADDLRELKQINPAAEVVCIPDAGHMVPWDNEADFVRHAIEFIRRQSNQRSDTT